jgi:hypothetical protein
MPDGQKHSCQGCAGAVGCKDVFGTRSRVWCFYFNLIYRSKVRSAARRLAFCSARVDVGEKTYRDGCRVDGRLCSMDPRACWYAGDSR